jgi:hypothetical protein
MPKEPPKGWSNWDSNSINVWLECLHNLMSIFIHALFIYGLWHICVNGIFTVMNASSWHSSGSEYLYPPCNIQWYSMIINLLMELWMAFSFIYTAHTCYFHVWILFHFMNYISAGGCQNSDTFIGNVCAHLMVTFTSMPHAFRHVHYTPLPTLSHFLPKNIVVMIHRLTLVFPDRWWENKGFWTKWPFIHCILTL